MTDSAANPVWLLAWGTLGIAILIAVIMLVRFYGKNRAHPMRGQRERNIEEIRDSAERR
jgi:hypothetical protein